MTTTTTAHTLDMEKTTGQEYFLPIGSTNSIYDFLDKAKQVWAVNIYNQNEFASELGYNLCTLYWPMTALSALIGRKLSKEERYELAKLRHKASDFDPSAGGYVYVGIDIVRNWWNAKNPNNKIVSFRVKNRSGTRRRILGNRFAYVSWFYGNAKYNKDASDGWLAGTYFGTPTYGHCTMELLSTVVDNYDNKYDRADYFGCARNGVLHNNGYVLFFENDLTEQGQNQVKAMKMWIWNGKNADKAATRFETATMIARKLYGREAKAKQFKGWNGKNGSKKISLYEVNTMFERAGMKQPRDNTRGAIAEVLGM